MSPGKRAIAVAAVAVTASLFMATAAQAAPTELTVRIEGKEKTLFEGPILTEGHAIRSASDTVSHHCDGTNNGAHPVPGPTPTAAAVDAMELAGQTFDARWFPGFDDYFIERWGPDEEDLEAGRFWGILVDGVLTSVGGCQYADGTGDDVLWAYDAFSGRSLLRLATADDPSVAPAAPAPTAQVEVDQPLALAVESYSGAEGQAPKTEPVAGVVVAPVTTAAGTGFQTVETGSPSAAITDGAGAATLTFHDTGWQRLKAQKESGFIRSNRLDVCVEPIGGGDCGPLPADARVRVPARHEHSGSGDDPPPSNALSLGRVVLHRRAGTATIAVALPGPGRVALSAAGIRPAAADAKGAETVQLAVRPLARGRARLRRRGRLKVALRVAFTPAGGTTATWVRELTLRLGSGPR